ncbi:MAG: DUF3800 domain-containing protein [Deltaproteobacteria bacterium]|nr:DUF3800 domain-containing protein [Deltaproteobacteria bacterium]
MDESGDLGFDFGKSGTTKYFVITLVFAEHKRPIEKCVKKVHAGLSKKLKEKGRILHAYHEKSETRIRLLRCLAEKDASIVAIILNKRKVHIRLREGKAVLYNYVTNILLDRIFTRKLIPAVGKIELIAERRETNKFLNVNFKDYLEKQVSNNHGVDLRVEIRTPEEKSLQAVDFASWAIFRKYEYGDDYYYKTIKGIIIEENPLFP